MRKDKGMISKAEMAEEQRLLDNIRKEIFGVYASKPKKTERKSKSPKRQYRSENVYTPINEVPVVVEYKIIRSEEKGLKSREKGK